MSGPERKVKDAIEEELQRRGAHWFMPVQWGMGKRAVDYLACVKGRFVAIEAKRADGEGYLTRIQKEFLRRTVETGGISVLVETVDARELVEALDNAGL